MPLVRCHHCAKEYNVRPIWRRSRTEGLHCTCGSIQPFGAVFWMKVLAIRLMFLAVGSAIGFCVATLAADPQQFPTSGSIAFGAIIGALLPELSRFRRRRRSVRSSRSASVPAESWQAIPIPQESGEVPVAARTNSVEMAVLDGLRRS